MAQKVYKGTKKKFAVHLTCPGFDQDTDDFEVEVKSGGTSVQFFSNPTIQGNHLFKETVEVPSEGSDEPTNVTVWYAIVDTGTLAVGKVKCIATAHVPDANATGGIRDEIDVQNLFELVEP